MHKLIPLLLAAALVACSPTQITTAETDVGKIATDVQTACTTVTATANAISDSPLALIPEVNGVLPYVSGACGTAGAVAGMVEKAVADPTTVAWINGLNTMLQKDVAAVKNL